MRRPDFRALAHLRLLAIDLGATHTGLAARTTLHEGPFPCGLIERKPRWRGERGSRYGAAGFEWVLKREDHARQGRITRHDTQAGALEAALLEHRAEAAVVGMPYLADGSRSRECAIVERQVAALQAAWQQPVPVLFWDESFSTRRVVGPRRPPAGSKASRASHALAACLILEEVVHALGPLEAPGERSEVEPGVK